MNFEVLLPPDSDRRMYEFSEVAKALYRTGPTDLCTLVAECLRANPNQRPQLNILQQLVNQKLDSDELRQEREVGFVGNEDDTLLLLPGDETRLKWASRIRGGAENVGNVRIPREQEAPIHDPPPDYVTDQGGDEEDQEDAGDPDHLFLGMIREARGG